MIDVIMHSLCSLCTINVHGLRSHCDDMLGWASHEKYRGDKVGYKTMRTLSRHAVKQYLPSGVESSNFTEKQDGAQK